MSAHYSPFTRRFLGKLEHEALKRSVTFKDAMAIQRAFVAALKEEVEARYPPATFNATGTIPNHYKPLVIAGLGSFKMRTRPRRTFDVGYPAEWYGTDENQEPQTNRLPRETVTKPPARRLVFTAKWEEIK